MFGLVKLIRMFIGGKTELGILVSLGAVLVFILPIMPAFSMEALLALLKVVGALTGVALLSRVEDKEGFLKALQSLFGAWRKK